jgi:hypothetical protein
MKKLTFIQIYIILVFSLITKIASAVPNITEKNLQGKTIKFIAILSEKLSNGYKVKIDYGSDHKLSTMSCLGTICTLSSNYLPKGVNSFPYKIGIYNPKGILQGSTTDNTYIISNSSPTLNFIDAKSFAIAGSPYTIQIKANDSDNDLDNITVEWGDGTKDSKKATNNTILQFSHIYLPGFYYWNTTAYDKSNFKSSNFSASLSIPSAAYTKISNSGKILPDTALLGKSTNDWACTKDNKTGLIWEIKTSDGGLRDMKKTYANQDANSTYIRFNNSNLFIDEVNKQNLCGSEKWRLPTLSELKTLLDESSVCKDITCTSYKLSYPLVNSIYFPNTVGGDYWTSTSYNLSHAWFVPFASINIFYDYKEYNYYVRLVHL